MAEAAPPTGMGNRQLREWIQEWGSAWDFLGLAPGSAMSEVLRASKRTAIRLHPDKSLSDEVEMATVRMQALGNAKEILLNPSLRILHDNILVLGVGTGGTGDGSAPVERWRVKRWRVKRHRPPSWMVESGLRQKPRHRAGSAKGKDKGRWGTPFYDTSSEEFSSGGPDTESSGPEIDRYPRIRCGRVLRCCKRGLPTGTADSKRGLPKARMAVTALTMYLDERGPKGPTEGTSQHGSALPTKAPPPRLTTRCGGSVEAVENLMGFIGMAAMGAVALDTLQERATHWICPDCQDETTIKANQCSGCGCWRPRHGSLINNGPAPDDLLVHPRASTDEQMEEEGVTALCRYSRTAPSQCRSRSPSTSPRKALEKGPLPPTPATPKSYAAPPPASGGLQPLVDPKARGPTEESRPMAIVAPNGEALWFSLCASLTSWSCAAGPYAGHMSRIHLANRDNPCFMDLHKAHPEPQGDLPPLSPATGDHRPLFTFQDFLRNPSLGQHYGGNEGPPRPGRAALPCIYPAPLRLLPLAETYAEADQAQNVMGRWAMQILGNGPAVPPDEGGASAPSSTPSGKGSGNAGKRATHWYCKRCSYGVPITRTICTMCNRDREQCVVSDDEEPEDDVVLNKEELEEVARLERECADLEQRMRGLNAGQQRALLENLANSSSAVMGGLLADTIRRTAQLRGQKGKGGSSNVKVRASNDTARNDPKYLADLEAGVSTAVAFQRHRSRLRAVQHQVAQGNVALQPRATPLQRVRALPPMMSLGRSHRLYLLNRLERLERRGVTWTQEEQFLDYLEARVNADAERAEPTTASKSAGAPPPPGVPPHTGTTASTPSGTSSAPSGTPADGRPEPPPPRSDQPEDREAGRPVPPDQGDDQPGAQPSAPSTTPEGGDAAGDTAPAGNDLPADDSAQSSAVGGFHL
ncbi:unnamed protein product [Symbiodinium sp. CCMP2592]|nr:unnamed protein product [Symbiodinium sp. CCMP2592]